MKPKKYRTLDRMAKKAADDAISNMTPEELKELDRLLNKIDGNHKTISITRATTCIHCPCCGHEIRIHSKEENI